jgi:hypothetical protein
VDGKNVALRPMQPGQHEHVSADGEVADGVRHVRVEHQPCIRRSFEPLLRGGLAIDQGRLDVPDRPDLVGSRHLTAKTIGPRALAPSLTARWEAAELAGAFIVAPPCYVGGEWFVTGMTGSDQGW